ncbi:type I restriction-modification system subunit M [Alienimonas chondri]|uniref:site-specific DNA-methyltransferase (adenine-specific) n=1 Tax=Alienimonas chondri TaxID=2681879 RepID=A0ABX1V953_9PLAN|nr:class I SAM-dependent DNA methyltransferase [Alienimonas chondri]NNJ24640.1 hypothetical protein [Alienimonas chondri]
MAKKTSKADSAANLGFEETLWLAADKMRKSVDAAEYKHVVLGLIFLKYVSDAFAELHNSLDEDEREDRDYYLAENVFWVPAEARWAELQAHARDSDIGKRLDDAMLAVERDNPKRLKGALPKEYARRGNDGVELGPLIDLIGTIALGDAAARSKDTLGRVYEYFLTKFAAAEGKNGGQFYTPRCVVATLVEILAPTPGSRIYDPCCGSGGMFVQSEKFVEEHGGRVGDVAVYGQESNATTWRLARMNLAIRGIDGDLGEENADTFKKDLHKDVRADVVIANPPFNDSDWHRKEDDVRWRYGTPPKGNANFAWVQHFLHHTAPGGRAGFVLANGSMSSQQSGEGEIRKSLVEADLVDVMVALPGQLFYSTPIPVCLWFVTRRKPPGREKQTLFLDARKLGAMTDRTHRELTDDDIARLGSTVQAWRGDEEMAYEDVPGFCKSATTEEIAAHGHVLTPGRYVGAEAAEEDDEPFEEKIERLKATLQNQIAESQATQKVIIQNLDLLTATSR